MNDIINFQLTITATNTPQQLPNFCIEKDITLSAKLKNKADFTFGCRCVDSTLTGFILSPGQIITITAISGGNLNQLWVTGHAGDILSGIGS